MTILSANNFRPYVNTDTAITLYNKGCLVLLLNERSIDSIDIVEDQLTRTGIKYIFKPKEIMVYDKKYTPKFERYETLINKNLLQVVEDATKLTEDSLSFFLDITPYIAYLHSSLSSKKFVNESIKFIRGIIKSVKYNNVVLIYSLNDKKLGKTINNNELYLSFISELLKNNDNKSLLDVLPLSQIIINYHNTFACLYHYSFPVEYKQYRQFLSNTIVSDIVFDEDKQITKEVNKLNDLDKQKLSKSLVNIKDISLSNKKSTDTIDDDNSKAVITPVDSNNNELGNKSYEEYMQELEQSYSSEEFRNNDSLLTEKVNEIQKSIITKIDDSQYNSNRSIPIVDDKFEESFNNIVNQDNIKSMPFLTKTKVKNDNFSDSNHKFVLADNESKLKNMLDELIPKITENKEQEKLVYNTLYSKFIKNPELLNRSLDAFNKNDLHQFFVYYNEYKQPYESKIYPEKQEVDKEVLKELDTWSEEHDIVKTVTTDPILNSDTISSVIPNNLHRVIAQKQLTWNKMPQEITKYITKVLEDSGFQLVDVSMVDIPPPITQIEPTYKSQIKIKIRNKLTKIGQTLSFDVPTLIEGKYHISGGIKWLFPNVIATLPIFIIAPGKVQFKTSYASLTFQHHSVSKKETVSVYVGGVKMLLLVWLLQFKSLDEIGKSIGFDINLYENRKQASGSTIVMNTPDRSKILGITITDTKNARLIKSLFTDLQTLFNRLSKFNQPFDFFSADEESEYIQLFTKKKKNLHYMFTKLKRYIIDKRTEEILEARGISPNLFDVSIRCANISINDVTEERLSINNVNLRLMDLIPTQVEKALHYAISEYNRRKLTDPDAKLVVNSGWVIQKLREESVLQLYKDSNLTIENAQLTGARIVGPGGFGKIICPYIQ